MIPRRDISANAGDDLSKGQVWKVDGVSSLVNGGPHRVARQVTPGYFGLHRYLRQAIPSKLEGPCGQGRPNVGA